MFNPSLYFNFGCTSKGCDTISVTYQLAYVHVSFVLDGQTYEYDVPKVGVIGGKNHYFLLLSPGNGINIVWQQYDLYWSIEVNDPYGFFYINPNNTEYPSFSSWTYFSGSEVSSITTSFNEPVTVAVNSTDGEYIIENIGTIEKIGNEWLVDKLCDAIRLTYTLGGTVRILEAFSIGEYNGKPFYNINVDDPVFKGFNVGWDLVFGWRLYILNYPTSTLFLKNVDTINPVFEDWVYQSGPTGISNLSTELIKKQCSCVKVTFSYNSTEYNYILNYSGSNNSTSEKYTFTDLNSLTVSIYLLGGVWYFSFSEDGENQANYTSTNLISNEWVDEGGDFTITGLTTTPCNPQATLSEDTPCPFGVYTIEEGSIFESFEVS